MKRKVLFINAEGLPFGYSASANKIRLMGEIISKSDFDVYSLHKRKGVNNRKYGYLKGIKFAFFCKNDSKNFFQHLFAILNAYIKEFFFVKKKSSKYEAKYILVHYDWFPIFLYYWLFSKIFKIKIVVNIMEWHMAVPSKNLFVKINKYLFDTLSFKMVAGAIPISKFIDNKIYKENKKLPTFVLAAITNFDEINSIDAGNPSTEEYILYCGNLGYMQVINFIVRSYSKIKNRKVKLMLVVNGKDHEFEVLSKVLYKYNVQTDVIIKSNLSFQDLIATYKNGLALLIPLRKTAQDLARFPHKISEYTASKRPIITTRFGVVNNYFDDKNAYISPKYSTIEYAKYIDDAIDNPQKSNSIGTKGYELGYRLFNSTAYNKTLPNFFNNL